MRAAQSQANNAQQVAGQTAANLGSSASGINSALTPFLTRELTNPQGYTQPQLTGMLASAEGSAGGTTGAIEGNAAEMAARTRNPNAFTGVLDDAARQKGRTLAQTAEGISASNANLQQEQQQDAARGLQGMYGTDLQGMLGAMNNRTSDINAEVGAGSSGWWQNLTGILGSLRGAGAKGVTI